VEGSVSGDAVRVLAIMRSAECAAPEYRRRMQREIDESDVPDGIAKDW
jgi:hypothetical protein